MKHFKVLFSDEYSKSGGKYGIVDVIPQVKNEYLLEDGLSFPTEMIKPLKFIFEGSEKDKELGNDLADFQMMYYPWRLISKAFYDILIDYSDKYILFYPVKVVQRNEEFDYFLMHFIRKLQTTEMDVKNFRVNDEDILYDLAVYNNNLSDSFIVSEKVAKLIRKKNITGISLIRIE